MIAGADFVAPAYAVTALVFAGLGLRAYLMLRRAARQAAEAERKP